MIYAYPLGTTDKTDPKKRIDSRANQGKIAVCASCDRQVVSRKNRFGVYEWVHLTPACTRK